VHLQLDCSKASDIEDTYPHFRYTDGDSGEDDDSDDAED
jgi:hypothetical protein